MKWILLILTFSCTKVFCQSEEEAVKATINKLFEGMKKPDTALIRESFSSDPVMQTIITSKDGKTFVRSEPVDSFIAFIGRPHTEVYDERIRVDLIKIDGNLAFAWTPYQFYVNDRFSHCGVNSFQLVKINGAWRIQYIIDTRRRQNCE